MISFSTILSSPSPTHSSQFTSPSRTFRVRGMKKEETFSLEKGEANLEFDDDGKPRRTGTWMSASAHIITAVVGSGVLSLTWCLAQLGWVVGTTFLLVFAAISWFTCILLTDCYRSPVTGARNYNYMQAVKTNLGGLKYKFCGIAQYETLIGVSIGYTITSSISMAAIKRSNCFYKYGHDKECHTLNTPYLLIFACIEIILSQIPDFHKLSFISVIATIMSFTYSSIGIGLSIARIADHALFKTFLMLYILCFLECFAKCYFMYDKGGAHSKTSLGIPARPEISYIDKMWNTFCAIGDIAFAYSFCAVLIEIQDTLKSSPKENKAMKTATTIGISASTSFYMLCGLLGYAAFGNDAPGNYLTGFGFYDPFWLIDIGNFCVVIHLLGAYQVMVQPFFAFVENWSHRKWPESGFVKNEYTIGCLRISPFRLVWRTTYVILATLVAMIFPLFNDFLALIGSTTFWPMTVYFPIEMYISQAKVRRNSFTWIWLKVLTFVCLIVSLLAAAGSIRGLVMSVKTFKLFRSVS